MRAMAEQETPLSDEDIIQTAAEVLREWVPMGSLHPARAVVAAVRPLITAQNYAIVAEHHHDPNTRCACLPDWDCYELRSIAEDLGVGNGDVSNTGDTERAGQHTDTPEATND